VKNSILKRGKSFCLLMGGCFGMMFVMVTPLKAVAEDYVIGDGDSLQIAVWDEPSLSTGVVVRPDGKITLPAVGDVVASGLTPMKLSEKLAEKMKEVVQRPIVSVTVKDITNNKIYVFGGGVPSGVNNLPGRTSLLRFLCKLGSLKGTDLEHAYIYRDGKKLDVNFYDIFVKGELFKDVMLKAEDVLYIPDNENNKIYLMGAVNAPKFVFYREGIKILDAIMDAGGFTKEAKENGVKVFRKEDKGIKEISVNVKDLMKEGDLSQNLLLVPGDVVFVKESIF
jgi:polysaccharide biosynthesis/export protein